MLKHKFLFLSTFIILSGLLFTGILSAQTLTYKKNNSSKESNSILEIKKKDVGYLINRYHKKVINVYITDNYFSTLKWTKTDPVNNTDMTVERKNNQIFVSGKLNNEKIDKTFKVDDLPWYQEWRLGLKDFINSKKDETIFW